MNRLAIFWATTFGTGFFPIAPGTVGSIFIIIIYYFLPPLNWITQTVLILVLFVIGVWASTKTEETYGHDASQINIDEVVGTLIAVWLIDKTWLTLLIGLVAFRVFDIAKPYPINKIQNLKAGWGVMMDDVLAGVFANLVLRLSLLFF